VRYVIAVLSDLHAGSKLGLLAPGTELEDPSGGTYVLRLSKAQQWLWQNYEDAIVQTLDLAGDDPVILIHNGDVCQGAFRDINITNSLTDQARIAIANLSPWFELGNILRAYIVCGTEAHDFGEASTERLIAETLRIKYGADVLYKPHILLSVDGASIDVAHHGPHPGSRAWLRGNIARLYLRDRIIEDLARGHKVPDLFVRSHRHRPVDEVVSLECVKSRIIVTPSWQLAGQFARKAIESPPYFVCGMSAIEVIDGRIVDVHHFYYELDIRSKEDV